MLSNSNLTYNTSTQVITGKISNISNHDTDDLSEGSTNQYFTTARARASVSATGDLSYNSSNGQFSVSVPSAFVSGMIILWSGNTGNIPTGFVLCDGNNGTPNLTDRFIVGAGGAYSPGATGGSSSVTLSTANLPSHNHSFSATTSNVNLSHNHGYQSANHPTGSGPEQNQSGGPEDRTTFNVNKTTGNALGNHNHTVSGTTGSIGSGSSVENRPPYYALCYIMKT